MTDPNTPGQNPQPTPPTPPAYGEYATTPPAAPDAAAPAYSAPAYASAPAYNGNGAPGAPIPGKTLGIVALIVAIFFNVIGLILGIVALVQSKKAGHKNGPALAAIIVGAVLFVIGVIVLIAVISWFATSGADLVTQVNACLDDPSGSIVYQGVTMSCQEVLERSNR
ncbi:DUF4190 domain-containing protein [Microbacterium dextranolyticum]|uniref:DUF4190 domain-containing protein n=1 Tax=Microbacterium dextranolyticum TaxID=36806 RepID=A0A9W6HQF1_9MICO|nr:DUF4190 domain-containing protein [Microbacterium dextranolyticum]MBM7462377.1 heme/copper-type cytochrome/quinol oxidase subunit 2 [Microbacterium dextranolyticum]GLJ96790.1 hypothetical protein GCM10017591_28530 [Microbacterium dextranolyticum]